MNIHLVRSIELDETVYWDVVHLLQQHPGPLRFLSTEEPIEIMDVNERMVEDEEGFTTKHKVVFSLARVDADYKSAPSFPMKERFLSWEDLFARCDNHRKAHDIGDLEGVFLLTDVANEHNWFSSGSEKALNGFVHTANWEYYFPGADRRFPIAYLAATLAMKQLAFSTYKELMKYVHQTPIGCAMDYCQDKKEVVHKMRTADVCMDCLEYMSTQNIPGSIFGQVFNIMSSVRESMLFKDRFKLTMVPSKMELRGHTQKIFLPDLGDIEIRLTPLEKTIYLFFLNHPEGVEMNYLPDHQEEISGIYQQLSNQATNEGITSSVEALVDPLSNSASEKISKIRRKFVAAVGEEMAQEYCIKGPNAGVKTIKLDRNLVVRKEA